jgi:pullulanase
MHRPQKRSLLFLFLLLIALNSVVYASHTEIPESVTVAGTLQDELGCPGEWQPECESTFLVYDEANDLWRATFDVPAGEYEYKVALNGGWTENYGGAADQDGPDVSLSVEEDRAVTFIYDHKTHWVADDVNRIIANVPGSFQSELGCDEDWALTVC